MKLRLETEGAAIVRGFLSDQDFSRIAEMAGNAFAFLDAGGGDTALRETWISVGTIWLTNLEQCVAPELARIGACVSCRYPKPASIRTNGSPSISRRRIASRPS
jgi:hypothetical protein